jgi:hypothetical protein
VTEELDLARYLTSHGVQLYRASGSEFTTHCFFGGCEGKPAKGKGKLYLNGDTWLYECKVCLERGNRRTLLQHFGDDDGVQHAKGADPMIHRRILTEAADLCHEMLLANAQQLDYLLERGVAPELVVAHRLGYVPANIGMSEMLPSRSEFTYYDLVAAGLVTPGGKEFFNDALTIPYFSYGQVVGIRGRTNRLEAKYLSTPGAGVNLYNADSLRGASTVLVVEGEFDTLAVASQILASGDRALEALAVVGLPGAGVWPEGFTQQLQTLSKVFIGLDPDETGRKAADRLKGEVGSKARLVALPSEEPAADWTDWFKPVTPKNPHGGHDWHDLRDLLIESDLAGKRLFSIGDTHAKWRKRATEAPGLKLGWPSLDGIIRPGLKPGQLLIPLAKSGTGKSVFLNNIVHNTRDKRVLYLSLELTAAEVFEHLQRIHHFWNPGASRDEMLTHYPNLRVAEHNRLRQGELDDLIEQYRDEMGANPELLIVDYLQYYARGFRGSPYERASDAAMELKAVLKEHSLAGIVPSQVNRGAEHGKPLTADDARDSGVVDETGDFVLALFRPDQVVSKDSATGEMPMQTGAFSAQWLKSRHGGKGRMANLKFSNLSLVITDGPLDRVNTMRVEQENALVRQGKHYLDYRREVDEAHAQGVLA